MIEHFSKWVELVPCVDKSADTVAYAFLNSVLSRFGAPAEVVSDQGSEFRGAFKSLLNQFGIDHRLASREHPQADGLAERLVQTMKQSLRKSVLERCAADWDLVLPYVAMGYRMTQQRALGYSPYFILYGRHPIFPAKIQDVED